MTEEQEDTLPLVSIKILAGHPQQRKDEISVRVTDAISEVAQVPKEMVWVVFEEVTAEHWYVGSRSVAEIKKGAPGS